MHGDTRRLVRALLTVAIFAIVPAIYAGTVVLADPFDFFGLRVSLADSSFRATVANAINPCLLKLARYRRQPAPHILLGDSRMASISAADVSARIGAPVANLAYGGASMQEMIDTFWFATQQGPLQSVTFGLALDAWNDYNILRRTEAMQGMVDNPGLYLTNRNVLTATWYALKARLLGQPQALDKVDQDREAFWRHILDEERLTYSKWREPVKYRAELARIAAWSKAHGVRLAFVRFPGHADVRRIVDSLGLGSAHAAMGRELAALGPFADFEGRSDITGDRTRYNDPIHFNHETGTALVSEIWARPAVTSPAR